MRNRAVRLTLVGVLLLAGAAAGTVAWGLQRRADIVLAGEQDVTGRLQQLIVIASEIGAAQRAYVAPGLPDQRWPQRVVELLRQLGAGAAEVSSRLRSADAATQMQAFTTGLEAFTKVDERVRDDLAQGLTQAAADLIFTEGRDNLSTTTKAVEDLLRGEQAAAAAERARFVRRSWTTLASAAGLWTIGLLLLAPVGRRPDIDAPMPEASPSPVPPPDNPALDEIRQPPSTLDLAAAAAICTDIARLTSAAALPDLLARAAVVLDASGIIIWMVAGDELFAVAAHGYDSRIVSRLGPIGRQANNATAAAWRTGELTAVSGDVMSNGAIVAPMLGAESCVGLLAAEMRHGREGDPATCAVATMIAAQLAAVVAALPSVGGAASDAAGPGTSTPPGAGGAPSPDGAVTTTGG